MASRRCALRIGSDRPPAGIGTAIGRFAHARGYTLIHNLASHGVCRSLHEEPQEVATWPTRGDRRRITRWLVLTVEPFLSTGGLGERRLDAAQRAPPAPVVQYEHTVVATAGGPSS